MNERFKFNDGREMNPFCVRKTMNETERLICWRLANAGPLGWNRRSLSAAHIKLNDMEALIKEGVIKKVSLLQMARDVIGNKQFVERLEELENEGGFLVASKEDRNFISTFDFAQQIVTEGETKDNQEECFQLSNNELYNYFQLF